MVGSYSLASSVLRWLISPGVLKIAAFCAAGAIAISVLSKVKAEQTAVLNQPIPALPWLHGTSDVRLQEAITRDRATDVASLLPSIPKSAIRKNIIARLAFDKYSKALDAFLNAGWSPDGPKGYESPVLVAASCGEPVALEILIKHKANIKVADEHSATPMLWASANLRAGSKMIDLLADRGANVDQLCTFREFDRDGKPILIRLRPLTVAVQFGNVSAVKDLLKRGASVNAISTDLPPIVGSSVCAEPAKIAALLLDAGADPNAIGEVAVGHRRLRPPRAKGTALYFNSFFGNSAAVKLLLDHGADPTITASTGKSALDVAKGHILDLIRTSMQSRAIAARPAVFFLPRTLNKS